jgi:endonuclease G
MERRILKILASLLLFVSIETQARIEAVIGPIPLAQNLNLANVMPDVQDSEIIISRDQYVISYNRHRRSPNWVAWKLEAKDIGSVSRSKMFLKDPDLGNYLAHTGGDTTVDTTEYNGSCFDRGHQIPSRDRTDTEINNQETFLTSNIIPQTVYLNRTIWEHLEAYTRDLVEKQGKTAYVIAGPIYDEDFGAIGPHHDIPVPSKDFKIVILLNPGQHPSDIGPNTEVISVVMPNVLQDGSKPTGNAACHPLMGLTSDHNDWKKYVTTIAEVQRISGIHFIKH